MLKDLRCDNDERVWECAYAAAFVQQLPLQRGAGHAWTEVYSRAADLASAVADQAVTQLRALRAGP